MESVYPIVEVLANVFDAIFIVMFTVGFSGTGLKSKKKLIACGIASAVVFATIYIINIFTFFEGLAVFIYTVELFVMSLFVLEGRIQIRLFAAALPVTTIVLVNTCVIYIISAVTGATIVEIFTEYDYARLIAIIGAKVLDLVIMFIILKIFSGNIINLNSWEWTLILFIFVASAYIYNSINNLVLTNEINTEGIILIIHSTIGLVLINIVSYYLINRMSRFNNIENEKNALQNKLTFQEEYNESITHQENEIRKIRHDMRNQYTVLQALIDGERNEDAKNYINELLSGLDSISGFVRIENEAINAIVNAKMNCARQKDIKCTCICLSDFNGFNQTDLCGILGNLFDNAIDAAEKCSRPREISLKITTLDEKMLINITNTAENNILAHNPKLITGKADKLQHGLGVKIIKSIAKKYSGNVNFSQEDGTFSAFVILNKIK